MLTHAATVQPGDEPDTYYSNSDMTKSDGTVVFETSNHDQCVGNSSYLSTASKCGKLFAKAVLYTWYRHTYWGAYL
jgi:hypothetical protein